MNFECLPNELFIDLFDYFDDIELLRIFYNLNSRFNRLIINNTKKFRLNFQSLLRKDMDFICQYPLPKLINRITKLRLSDDDDTPYQIRKFFSYKFQLNQFKYLKILSLYHIRCSNIMNQILSQLSQLQRLICLKIDQIHFPMNETDQFTRIIWSLPKLRHFYIEGENFVDYQFLPGLVVYASFTHLSMIDSRFDLYQLTHLLECLPHLETLMITVYQHENTGSNTLLLDPSFKNILPPLKKLYIKFDGYLNGLEYLFELTPYLRYLKIETYDLNINGYTWKRLIRHYFSKLKTFHLQMLFNIPFPDNIDNEIDELLNSFKTSFWISKRKLFFRCHWIPKILNNYNTYDIILHTLPYAFNHFDLIQPIYSKSTCPNQTDYWYYNHVRTLKIVCSIEKQDLLSLPVRFFNLRHLTISSNLGNFENICPKLDQLITLHIESIHNQIRFDLQKLLDQTTKLQTIIFSNIDLSDISINSQTIRRVIINNNIYYNVQQCAQLCRSILFTHCETLHINITTRGIILDFIRKLANLRCLLFKCQHDEWKANTITKQDTNNDDELIKWLKRFIPTDCLIKREKHGAIRLWLA